MLACEGSLPGVLALVSLGFAVCSTCTRWASAWTQAAEGMRTHLVLEHDGEEVEDTLAKLGGLGAVLAHALARSGHVTDGCGIVGVSDAIGVEEPETRAQVSRVLRRAL